MDFIIRKDPLLNAVKWQKTIDYYIKTAHKYPLLEINSIPIYSSELKIIKSIDGVALQRLLFSMLCLCKYGNVRNKNNNNWVNKKDREIFSLANIKVTTQRQSLMINDLKSLGLVSYSVIVDNTNINVPFVESDGKIELEIQDFRNVGYQYMNHIGSGSYISCACCGILVPKRSNAQRYCSECAIGINVSNTGSKRKQS